VQTKLTDKRDLLNPILARPNTLIYICGLKGMEEGIYRELYRQELYDFLEIKEELVADGVDSMDSGEFKRAVKPSDRTFEEVY
jgi:ferredoxin--NADP+ reductase